MFPNGNIEWEKSRFSESVPAWVLFWWQAMVSHQWSGCAFEGWTRYFKCFGQGRPDFTRATRRRYDRFGSHLRGARPLHQQRRRLSGRQRGHRHVRASQPVTASPTRYRNSVVPARPPATAPPAGWSAPAAVLDCDLDLVALKKTRFSPQPLDLAANFPSRRDAALVGLQDDLRLALAHDPPGGLVR